METIWNISDLQRSSSDDVVTEVSYKVIFKMGDAECRHTDSIALPAPSEENGFIEYQNLDEELIIGWVKSTMGDDALAELEARYESFLQDNIQKNQEFLNGAPWHMSREEKKAARLAKEAAAGDITE